VAGCEGSSRQKSVERGGPAQKTKKKKSHFIAQNKMEGLHAGGEGEKERTAVLGEQDRQEELGRAPLRLHANHYDGSERK